MNEYNLRRDIRGVVIDAGHGGDDPGALGNGITEKDYTLEASLYMGDRLEKLGIPVKYTRTTDTTLSPTERTNKIKNAFGNYNDVIVISNHLNAGGGDGAETIYALRNNDTLAKSILESIEDSGQNIRKYYQRRLPSDPSKDYYFIHRLTGNTQPVIIEYGFLDSPDDDVSQLKNNYLDYVEAAVKAIAEYVGVTYIPPEGSNVYIVKKGDSLWSIANKYGVTVDELIAANNLKSNILNIGQAIKIPTKEEVKPGNYIVYTVKSGDNLYDIANTYNTTVNDIVSLNNLSTTTLQIGQQLLIPSTNATIPENSNIYTVQKGDSLWSIANKYGINVDDLITANSLTNNNLSIGQQLYIPIKTTSDNEYIVKKGDSLWLIANNFNVTVDELKELNNLTSNNLSVGQLLKIPTKETTSNEIVYVVQTGDSLWSIAKKYNINVNELKEYNNITSNLLSIGQELKIPQTENYITYYVKSGDNLWDLANEYNTTVNEIKNINNLTNNNLSIGQTLLLPNN